MVNMLEYDTDMLSGSYPGRKYMVCIVMKHHIVEMRRGVTNAGRQTNEQ